MVWRTSFREVQMAGVLKFSTLGGGLFLEVRANDGDEWAADTRCFRFDANGNAEYAFFADVVENGDHARFYGHVSKERNWDFA
jgi:hypothetical protein